MDLSASSHEDPADGSIEGHEGPADGSTEGTDDTESSAADGASTGAASDGRADTDPRQSPSDVPGPAVGDDQPGADDSSRPDGGGADGEVDAADGGAQTVGPGVTDATLTLGVQYPSTDRGGSSAAFGKDISAGDVPGETRVLVDYINRNGGIAGRKLEVVLHPTEFVDSVNNVELEAQKTCTKFTEDHQVLAAVVLYATVESLVRCMADAHVPVVSWYAPLDAQVFAQLPRFYYAPGAMNGGRGAAVAADVLAQAGFFDGAKIALFRHDAPTYERSEQVLRQALEAHGLTLDDVFATSSTDLGQVGRDAAAASFRFNANGITHVLFLDLNGVLSYTFMNAAEGQSYRPTYALSSNNGPTSVAEYAPTEQLRNTRIVSWAPYDAQARHDESPPAVAPTTTLCREILLEGGYDLADRTEEKYALNLCGDLLFLKTALDAAAAPNAAELERTVDGMGTSFAHAASYGSRLGPGRHDGAENTRVLVFDATCNCFRPPR